MVRLEGRVFDLTAEKDKLAADLEGATKALEEARSELERCKGKLKRVSDLFPDLAAGSDLAGAVDDLKASAKASFDKGFEAALEHLKVLYPDADVDKFDIDKIMVNGQIVAEDAPATNIVPTLDLATVDAFLNNDDGMEEVGGAGEDAVGHMSTDGGVDSE